MAEMSGQGNEVEQQLLSANPIIEAFGNAKTVRNNNSSRFGKWIEVKFDAKYHIVGATIFNYLLEKSRIVDQAAEERNYHIFYNMCLGAPAAFRKKYALDHPSNFRVTSGGDTYEIPGLNEEEEWRGVQKAFDVLNVATTETDALWATTAAVLHLGNVMFAKADKTSIKSGQECGFPRGRLAFPRCLWLPDRLHSECVAARELLSRFGIVLPRLHLSPGHGREATPGGRGHPAEEPAHPAQGHGP